MENQAGDLCERLFHEARALNREQRGEFLKRACADPVLRRKVETLLRYDDTAGGFLMRPIAFADDPPLPQGARISHYEVVGVAGVGGMGVVYRAKDTRLGREVAIKTLPRGFVQDHECCRRLEHEATLLASFNHPNIATIHDVIERAGTPYLVLEFVEGITLAERLQQGALSITESVSIANQIAHALEAAHSRGVVHCDLKPANIKILPPLRVKLLDFGIATALQDASAQTGDAVPREHPDAGHRALLGTPAYSSPEQATGAPAADERADVWALGCVLYEMLTGRQAFRSDEHADVLESVLHESPDWTLLSVETPRALTELLQGCLQKDPNLRRQRMAEIRREIGEIQSALDRPKSLFSPAFRRIAAAVAGLAVVLALWYARETKTLGVLRNVRVTFSPEMEVSPALSPDGNLLAYERRLPNRIDIYVKPVGDAGEGANLSAGLGTVEHHWPQWSPDGSLIAFISAESNLNDHQVEGKSHLEIVPWTGGTPRTITDVSLGGHAWSPGGQKLAFIRNGAVSVVSLLDGDIQKIGYGYEPHAPAWSPDGKWIVYASGNARSLFSSDAFANLAPGSLWIVPATGGTPRQLTDATNANTNPVWLPDSASILFVSNRGGSRDVFQLKLSPQGEPLGEPVRVTTGLNALTISPMTHKGDRLAYALFLRKQNLWSLPIPDSGTTIGAETATAVTTGSQVIEGVNVTRDGEWIAYDSNRSGNQDIYRLRRSDGQPARLTDHPSDDFLPSWSPNRELIAFYSFRNGNRDIYVMSNDGTNQQQVTSDPAQERYPDWSPDGGSLVYFSNREGAGDLYIVSREGSGWSTPRRLTSGDHPAFFPHWSPDGKWIAYTDGVGGLYLISPDGRNMRQILSGRTFAFPPRYVVWSDDSKTLYFKANENLYLSSLWSVSLAGGDPQRLVRFDLPQNSIRGEFGIGGNHFFFTLSQTESDVWMLDLAQ